LHGQNRLSNQLSEMAGEPCSLQRLKRALAALLQAASNAFRDTPEEAHECVRRALAALRIDPGNAGLTTDGDSAASLPRAPRGGLAPWQARKLTTYIETHLDSSLDTATLASLVKLSTFYFCRAFRETFNTTPHAYVMRRRIEGAQELMLQTNASLAQIAMDCGFADQAHLTKAFRRFVTDTPGAWRRARVIAPADSQRTVVNSMVQKHHAAARV